MTGGCGFIDATELLDNGSSISYEFGLYKACDVDFPVDGGFKTYGRYDDDFKNEVFDAGIKAGRIFGTATVVLMSIALLLIIFMQYCLSRGKEQVSKMTRTLRIILPVSMITQILTFSVMAWGLCALSCGLASKGKCALANVFILLFLSIWSCCTPSPIGSLMSRGSDATPGVELPASGRSVREGGVAT
jgi:hypothetical protein